MLGRGDRQKLNLTDRGAGLIVRTIVSDSNEFYSTPGVNAHLDLIRHLIENSELVPLVRGPEGIGKSLLASRLQQSAPENWVVCHFSADPSLQPERLLAFIARCSGLPDIAGDLLQRLADRFEVLRKRGKTPVLLVDDAQMLPPTSLITLLRLFERQVEGARLVSIVLFADEQIDLLLSTPQLQVMSPQVIQAIDMPLLTRQEATGFMHFLLKTEGLSEQFGLDESRLNRLHKECGGVPGLLATAILDEIGQQGSTNPTFFSGYRKQLILIGLPILSVIFLLLLFQGPINALFESAAEGESVTEPPLAGAESNELVLPPPQAVVQNPVRGPTPSPTTDKALPTEAESAISVSTEGEVGPHAPVTTATNDGDQVIAAVEGLEQVSANDPVSAEFSPEDGTLQRVEVADVTVSEAVKPEHSEAADQVPQVIEPKATAADITPPSPAIETETEAEAPESEAELAKIPEKSEEVVSEAAPAVSQIDQTPAIVPKTTHDVKNDRYSEAVDWVRSQPSGYYTLQLIAVENITSLQRFIKENGLDDQTVTVKTMRKGVPWYCLVWGSFATREQALAAQSKLPAAIQKGGVWARTFASLQAAHGQ
jgi:septal ring-binding cell division protein DamX/type II secretory pathway predicted ATPase ExeA